MKKISFVLAGSALLAFSAITATSLSACTQEKEVDTGNKPEVVSQRLVVDTTNTKLDYLYGDSFTNEGLVVSIKTTYSDDSIKETATSQYKFYIDSNEIKPGDVLDSYGTFEVVVQSTISNVISAHFEIKVTGQTSSLSLLDIVNEMLETSYTVDSKIYAGTEDSNYLLLQGLVTTNGVYWKQNGSGGNTYDLGYSGIDSNAYSTYNDRTFKFNIIDNKVTNASYLEASDGYNDDGLFSNQTMQTNWNERIANYSAHVLELPDGTITWSDEMNYIKNIEPEADGSYLIPAQYSRWVLNTVGLYTEAFNPGSSYKGGTIRLTVNDNNTLTIKSTSPNSYLLSAEATVSKIDSTQIPGLNEFLENPSFGYKPEDSYDETITALNNTIKGNNYTLTVQTYSNGVIVEQSKKILFNERYIYSDVADYSKYNYIGSGNIYYPYTINGSTVTPNMEGNYSSASDLLYLANFKPFKDDLNMFESRGDGSTYQNTKSYTDGTSEWAKLFAPGFDQKWLIAISSFKKDNQGNYTEFDFAIQSYVNDGVKTIGGFTLTNIGTTTNSILESYLNS